MEIIIKGSAKEIVALVLELQEQHSEDVIVMNIDDVSKAIMSCSSHDNEIATQDT